MSTPPPRVYPRRAWRLLGVLVTVSGATAFLWMGGVSGVGWRLVNGLVQRRFPDVRAVSTAELSASLEDPVHPGPKPLLLLDVREPAEYAVSHVPGARCFPPGAGATALTDWPKDAPVVTYCSVGYRSAALAQRLQAAGFTDVRNLRGSIFAWANEDRPLVDTEGRPTAVVHPYDRTWGTLVAPAHRATIR